MSSGYRLLDILNDRMSEFLERHDVRVAADGAVMPNKADLAFPRIEASQRALGRDAA